MDLAVNLVLNLAMLCFILIAVGALAAVLMVPVEIIRYLFSFFRDPLGELERFRRYLTGRNDF